MSTTSSTTNFHTVSSESSYTSFLSTSPSHVHLLFFTASWHPPCSQIHAVVKEMAEEKKDLQVAVIEAEDLPNVTEKYKINAVPTVVFVKNGQQVDSVEGANVNELVSKVAKHHALSAAPANTPAPASSITESAESKKGDLNERLSKLVNASPVLLFMKGTPSAPRCGFSKQTVELLTSEGVRFDYFDILSDNDVREGLKKFSNWPTYPQFYVKGSLVGGFDVLKELKESNELKSQIPHEFLKSTTSSTSSSSTTTTPSPSTSSYLDKSIPLNDRLKSLLNSQRVMLFMKGTPTEPRCGFSKRAVSLLDEYRREHGIDFGTFDILSSEEIRQGLKEYSNWPTYPQLYVNGKLIGGVDIIAELKEAGELLDTLQQKPE